VNVIVDFDNCMGNGNCMLAAPEVFEVRNDGIVHILADHPSEELRAKVQAAATLCPTQAIKIEG